MCSFYILENDYFYGNLADSRDLYSHAPPLFHSQLHRRQEGGFGAKKSRRQNRTGSLRQCGCQLRRQGAGQEELAQVQGNEEEEERVTFDSIREIDSLYY
jgi:hypothetical protein